MSRLRYAGLTGSLATGGLTASATTHTFPAALTYANGVTVPTLTGTDYFLLTILNSGRVLSEVVKVTAYDSGTKVATLVRGQEDTVAIAHVAGDAVTQYAYPTDFASQVLSEATADYAYIGKASPGTETSSPEWTVTRITYPTLTSGTVIETGSGAWDDRATLTYV